MFLVSVNAKNVCVLAKTLLLTYCITFMDIVNLNTFLFMLSLYEYKI